jgi:hypothetical protein
MHNGDPFISRQTIKSALDDLLYSAAGGGRDEHSPAQALYALTWVTERLADADMPPAATLRQHIAQDGLLSLIQTLIDEYRLARNLPALDDAPATRDQAEAQVRQAPLGTQEDLCGLSWLYYHYQLAHLGLEQATFAAWVGVHLRTLQRYEQRALQLLERRLIDLETAARTRQRQRRLLAALPSTHALPLYGRDFQLATLLSLAFPFRAYITGDAGLGKSALVQEAVQRQIREATHQDAVQVQYVLWFDRPANPNSVRDDVYAHLTAQMFPADSRPAAPMPLAELLLLCPTVVVLDNAELLLRNADETNRLLLSLSAACVYITTREPMPCANISLYLNLRPLTEAETVRLIQTLAPTANAAQVWHLSGGNPRLIGQALMAREEAAPVHYADQFTASPLAARHLWVRLAVCPPLARADLLRICDTDEPTLNHLLRWQIVIAAERTPTPNLLTLSAGAQLFVQQQWQTAGAHDALLRESIAAMIQRRPLQAGDVAVAAHWLDVALPTIYHPDMPEAPPSITDLLEHFAPQALAQGGRYAARWVNIFARYQTILTDTQRLMWGLCLRRLGHWEEAFTLLEALHRRERVDFDVQRLALLELAALSRAQGHLSSAQDYVARVGRGLPKRPRADVLQRFYTEQAHLALEQGDNRTAGAAAAQLALSPQRLALQGEVALNMGDTNGALRAIDQALTLAQDMVTRGRLYAQYGRATAAAQDLISGYHHLAHAVTLLEQAEDMFGLGRALTNLAALMLAQDDHTLCEEIDILLTRAHHLQMRLQDRHGLQITAHNQQHWRNRCS